MKRFSSLYNHFIESSTMQGKRIQGYWNDEITQRKLKEATRRCGCNSSFGIIPPTINILVALVGYALWI